LTPAAWLKENATDDSIRKALNKGWSPPNVEKAIDWWKERITFDPNEHIEEVIDELIGHLCFEEKMEHVLSYYAVEADNFLLETTLPKVETMKWLEERNSEGEFLNRNFLRIDGRKSEDCGRGIVRMLYVKGAKKVDALPIKAPDIAPWGSEYTDTLFVEFPDDWNPRMKLWVYITNLHPKEVELESEGPVVVRVTF
jgi:hypothetical protein